MAYCILSCDGGGIRGLLPALIVQRLTTDIPAFLDQVNLFAGTSAGAFVALGLASQISVNNIVDLFEKDGVQIFQQYASSVPIDAARLAAAREALASVGSGDSWWTWIMEHLDELLYVKYTNAGLQQLLEGLLPRSPLGQLSKSVLVTTFQLDDPATGNWAPITISNLPHDPTAATYPVDAALSTSAAPTYFPPYQHPTLGYCIDGGVFANNPGCMALAAALRSGVLLSDIVMLSVGTGAVPENMQISPPPTNYGPLLWMLPVALGATPASPILSILMDGVASADAFICKQLLRSKFLRLEVPLTSPIRLDDYQSVSELESAAMEFMKTADWTEAERWVKQNFVSSQ